MDLTTSLEERVATYVAEHLPALATARAAVLAVSGGGDSLALVALLCEAGIIYPTRSVIAHFDHRLRGEADSRRDRDAVDDIARRYRMHVEHGAWSTPARGEAAARSARYAFLTDVAKRYAIVRVATGHTSDDHVETVVMHAMRGSGMHGLAGMLPETAVPLSRFDRTRTTADSEASTARVVRPLLAISRHETREYCAARHIRFVDDPSNEDLSFTRNRVRLQLLPQLDRTMPDARNAITRLAESARSVAAGLEQLAAPLLLDSSAHEVRISRKSIRDAHPDVAAHAYRLALVQLLGDARDYDRRHFAMMLRAAHRRTGATYQLPRDVALIVDADHVVMARRSPEPPIIDPAREHPLPFVGTIGAWQIDVHQLDQAGGGGRASVLPLPPNAVVRGWRPGDRIQPKGMRGHKKLQDVFVDKKVPRRERHRMPLIAIGAEILWAPVAAAEAATGNEGLLHAVSWERTGGAGARDGVNS